VIGYYNSHYINFIAIENQTLLTVTHLQRPGLLAPVSFTLEAGETLCLSGPSGIGKTVLLRAIADLDPNQGEVILDGIPRESCSAEDWRRKVMLIPSESFWWAERVGDHFKKTDNHALQLLEFTDSVLGWEVARLSSGERQRLAVLRALSYQPEVLLLDEPTANLDEENVQRVEQLLRNYQDKHAVAFLWVSHSQAQRSRVADRELRFTKAGLVEQETIA
jgi:ABC-type iron transport system FetAB ATPase subunit